MAMEEQDGQARPAEPEHSGPYISEDGLTMGDRSAARQELMAETRKLLDEIRQRNESLSALLETRVQELRHAKTDRSTLAAIFVELAMRLKDDGDEVKERPKSVRSAGA